MIDVDALAQEIRRVDGDHTLGAGALAEALMPFLRRSDISTLNVLGMAKRQIISLGGDPRGDANGDHIQAAVLDELDLAIARAAIAKAEGR